MRNLNQISQMNWSWMNYLQIFATITMLWTLSSGASSTCHGHSRQVAQPDLRGDEARHLISVMRAKAGDHVTVFFRRHRMPVTESDFAVITAAGDARRTALLLAATHAIGKSIVSICVVHLRRGLVVP